MTAPDQLPRLANGLPHQARKRFGQHFLTDRAVIRRIMAAIAPQPDQHLVEIGPGQGALTTALANSGARLDCVELDRDLASFLQHRYRNRELVTIHPQDILQFDLGRLPAPGSGGKSLRVVGNLPYNISTPVLFYLLQYHPLIQDITCMLQLEVVQRLTARRGDSNYGRLGLMARYYCRIEHLFNVPCAAFRPQPRVSSALVRLTPHQHFPVTAKHVATLELVIRTAFSQRRKTLKNSLKSIVSGKLLEQLAIDAEQRPERQSLRDFVLISDALWDERGGAAASTGSSSGNCP